MPVQPGAEPFAHTGSGELADVGAVLCHGFTGNPSSMRPWGEYLAQAGLTVVGPRLPGHGTRWQELNDTRWPDWYGELERAFDDLRQRCSTVLVMGLSMGGTLALHLAAQRTQQVAGLVLVNPSLLTLRKDAKLLPVLSKVLPSRPGIGDDIAKAGVSEGAYTRLPLRAAYSLQQLWPVVRAELGQITAPTLLLRSIQDHVVEPASAEALRAGMTPGLVTEVTLERSYHVATLDHDAPLIYERSLDHARRLAGAGTGP